MRFTPSFVMEPEMRLWDKGVMKAMLRGLILSLCLALATILAGSAHGSVRRLNDLSVGERLKLDQSQRRTVQYDRALQLVEKLHVEHRLSRQEYQFQERELVSFIGAEAGYQNDLLVHASTFSDDTREVLENVAKYSIEIPAYIVAMVAEGWARSGGYSYTLK